MAKALPDAPVYTAFYWPEVSHDAFRTMNLQLLPIGRVPGLYRHHRATLPLLAPSFSRFSVDAEVVIAGTSGWAAGVRTSGRKVLYFHSLARWLYEPDQYLSGRSWAARAGLAAVRSRLIDWDRRAVESADRWLVYGSAMGARVREVYGIEAEILSPPVTIDPDGPQEAVAGVEPGFFLCPCRLLPYKNIDVVLDAFARLPD